MPDQPPIQWQPITMLPLLLQMAEDAYAETVDLLMSVSAAAGRPGVLDAATCIRAQALYTDQAELLEVYAQQAQRWRNERPSAEQRMQLDQLADTVATTQARTRALLAAIDRCLAVAADDPVDLPSVAPDSAEAALREAAEALMADNGTQARRILTAALATTTDPGWRAELLAMRAWVFDSLSRPDEAQADARAALAASAQGETPELRRQLHYGHILLQLIREDQPEEAWTLALAQAALIETHQATVLTDPELAHYWPGVVLELALQAELREDDTAARHWYPEAARRCTQIGLTRDDQLAQLVMEGMARVG